MTYFIALIVFLLPSYLIRFSIPASPAGGFNIPTTLLEVLIYIAFIWTIVLKISNNKLQIPNKFQISNSKSETDSYLILNTKYLIPIILFIISGVISVVIAPDKKEALGLFKAYIIDPIIFFWIILANFNFSFFNFHLSSNLNNLNIENSLKIKNFKLKILIKSLILSGVIVAIYAIWQKITGNTTPDGRVLGIFSSDPNASPNYLAFYLAPIATLAFSLFINQLSVTSNQKDKFKKIIFTLLHVTCYMLLLLALWFSGSRAAIGAVMIGTISYFIIKYWQIIKSKRIFVYMFICSLVLMIAVGWQMTKPDWQLSPAEGGRISSSNNIRWEIWKTTAKDIIPHNLIWLKGVGLGNYQNYFTDLTQDRVNFPEWISPLAVTPHNLFLNIWVNLGLLGLIAFIWLLYDFFKLSIINYQLSINKNLVTCHLLLVTVMMITILIQGLVDSPIWKNDLAVMFWLLLSLSLVISSINIKKQGEISE